MIYHGKVLKTGQEDILKKSLFASIISILFVFTALFFASCGGNDVDADFIPGVHMNTYLYDYYSGKWEDDVPENYSFTYTVYYADSESPNLVADVNVTNNEAFSSLVFKTVEGIDEPGKDDELYLDSITDIYSYIDSVYSKENHNFIKYKATYFLMDYEKISDSGKEISYPSEISIEYKFADGYEVEDEYNNVKILISNFSIND